MSRWELYDTHYTERYMGDPRAVPEAYARADTVGEALKIADPLLIIHGMADDNVVLEHSTVMMARLQAGARAVRGHALSGGTPTASAGRASACICGRPSSISLSARPYRSNGAAMLSLNDITVRLGGRTIIDRAGAALPPRSRVGLIGRNGAGKSTLVRVIAGMLDPDDGSAEMPRGTRIGYIAQEAPGGDSTPFETVLAADIERAALMAESETCHDPDRLGELHERLNAIDAHAAPARAARILVGLGFDEAAQHQPLESFSGGWRMRVALAALLFSAPDLLLLDEPSNHLDLEAVLWLEDFLKSYGRDDRDRQPRARLPQQCGGPYPPFGSRQADALSGRI